MKNQIKPIRIAQNWEFRALEAQGGPTFKVLLLETATLSSYATGHVHIDIYNDPRVGIGVDKSSATFDVFPRGASVQFRPDPLYLVGITRIYPDNLTPELAVKWVPRANAPGHSGPGQLLSVVWSRVESFQILFIGEAAPGRIKSPKPRKPRRPRKR